MSRPQKYRTQCKNKRGYSTPDEADEARIKNHSGMAEFYCSYFCCFCSMWHVGHRVGYKAKEVDATRERKLAAKALEWLRQEIPARVEMLEREL